MGEEKLEEPRHGEATGQCEPETAAGCRRDPRGHPRGGHPPLRHPGLRRAGVREIAADAGVTAALVNRYFGSKEGLFAEVIRRALDMGHLLEGQRGDLADHLARVMVYGREGSRDWGYTPLLLLLHSATVPGAIKLFRRDLDRTELPILAEQIGGDDAAVRAVMVMAQLTGFAIVYHVLRPKAFANARGEELVTLLSGGPRRLYQVRPRGYGFGSLSRGHTASAASSSFHLQETRSGSGARPGITLVPGCGIGRTLESLAGLDSTDRGGDHARQSESDRRPEAGAIASIALLPR